MRQPSLEHTTCRMRCKADKNMEDDSVRQVFELCDADHSGTVSTGRIIELARQTSIGQQDEAIQRLQEILSECGEDSISYEQFCNAVRTMLNDGGQGCNDLVKRMSQTFRDSFVADNGFAEIPTDEAELTDAKQSHSTPSMDDSSLTFNEYDYSTMKDDDTINGCSSKCTTSKRESIASNTVLDESLSSEASLRQIYKDDLNDYTRRLQEDAVYELADKVHSLKDQISSILQERFSQVERLHRVQNENTELRNRLMIVEERLQDMESVSGGHLNVEDSTINKIIDKYEHNLNDEKEILQRRISKVENELSKTKEENQLIKRDMSNLTNRMEQLDLQLRESEEAYDQLRKQHAELVELYNSQVRQLEENSKTIHYLQMSSQPQPGSADGAIDESSQRSSGDTTFFTTLIQQLQDSLENLKEENARLKEENKLLMAERMDMQSFEDRLAYEEKPWATELDMMSKEELQSKVQDLLSENARYRIYVERINARILQEYPDLLENVDINR